MIRVLLALGALAFLSPALRAADRPNILWIVAEDISPFFGCYGNPDATTPFLDAYAARSHVFLDLLTAGGATCALLVVWPRRRRICN